MKFWSHSIQEGKAIPPQYAFCQYDPINHLKMSDNKNPHFAWSDLPAKAKSLALICHDYDVPSQGDHVNQEGKVVSASLARVDFFHWVLIDLPISRTAIEEGEFSNGITPRGKSGPEALDGSRQGINDYTGWFASDKEMAGNYFGYDGCCPPWNDEIPHHYVFTLYALDIEKLPVSGIFTGQDVWQALKGHVLDKATITGTYSLNPDIIAKR